MNDQAIAAGKSKDYFHRPLPLAAANVTDESYRNWTCDETPRKPAELKLAPTRADTRQWATPSGSCWPR